MSDEKDFIFTEDEKNSTVTEDEKDPICMEDQIEQPSKLEFFKKKFKRKVTIKFTASGIVALFVIILISFFVIGGILSNGSKKYTAFFPNSNSRLLIVQEAFIDELISKNELIPLEAEVHTQTKLDKSWSIFKKVQDVEFYGTAIYSVDLSTIDKSSIYIDKANKAIVINLRSPSIKTISIDQTKTVFKNTENGLFRFGDLKLSATESNFVFANAKAAISEKLEDPSYLEQAKKNTSDAIQSLLGSAASKSKYKIKVNFVD